MKAVILRGAYTRRLNQGLNGLELTPREREILGLMNSGLTKHKIAQRLGLRLQTVKNHLVSVYEKLGVAGRQEAVKLMFIGGRSEGWKGRLVRGVSR